MELTRTWSSDAVELANPKRVLKNIKEEVRQRVTGDKRRSMRQAARELVVEELKKPDVLRKKDIFAFCLGVLGIMASEWVLLSHPDKFWMWYCALMPPLLIVRYFLYRRQKMHYFMIDFCYFSQALLTLELLVFRSTSFFEMNFMFSQGPLAIAVIAWRNSLVFHSLDRVTSCFIHMFPMLVTYTQRWTEGRGEQGISASTFCCGVGVYLLWQVGYLLETEVRMRKKFQEDEDLQSSLRWLSLRGEGIPVVKCVRKVLIAAKVLDPAYKFNPAELKTKLIMVLGQLVFTLVCLLPTLLIYQSYLLHTLYIVFVVAMAVWNGATYYFEVFAGGYEHRRLRMAKGTDDSDSQSQGSSTPESPPSLSPTLAVSTAALDPVPSPCVLRTSSKQLSHKLGR